MSKIAMRQLYKKVIAFNPIFAKILNHDCSAGILLSQLCYWAEAMNFKEFYKSNLELQDECVINKDKFLSARKKIIDLGIFSIKKMGNPCKIYYTFNEDRLIELIELYCEKMKNTEEEIRIDRGGNPHLENRKSALTEEEIRIDRGGNPHSLINNIEYTENTTENTTDIRETKVSVVKKITFDEFALEEQERIQALIKQKKCKTIEALKVLKSKLLRFKQQDFNIVEALNEAIGSGWETIYPPKIPNSKYSSQQKPIKQKGVNSVDAMQFVKPAEDYSYIFNT